ncbi:MAG: energy transducer TonB [Sphingopyxis sp.]|uniref:energy transducer TonB n=1 Tax=Sphingopyxis sp. TaxID=1908224 RepID=UPI003D811B81
MGYTGQISRRQRIASGGATAVAVMAIGAGLASGPDLGVVRKVGEAISAIAIPAPPPPAPVVAQTLPSNKTSGRASAANRHAEATAVVTPPPKLPPVVPPIATAPVSGIGNDRTAGATPTPGPGSGAGGRGDGTGAGGTGRGTGSGTRPVWHSGRIEDRDYPRAARRARTGGDVEVRFTIEPTGRVTGCRVSRSSGDASLDDETCRLIEARFRFRPATDGSGRAIASSYGWRQAWWLERRD